MSPKPHLYKIISHSDFDDELTQIVEYLSDDASHKAASQMMEDLVSQLDLISTHPFIYPAYPPRPSWRKMAIRYWHYVVFYTINKQKRQIILTHIFHMSRDIHSLIEQKNI